MIGAGLSSRGAPFASIEGVNICSLSKFNGKY